MIKTINLEKGGIVLEKFWAGIKKGLRPVLQLGHAWLIQDVVFTPDGKTLISGSDTEIKYWDVESGKLLKSIKHSENGWLLAMGINPDGKTLITISQRSGRLAIKFWDIRTGKFIKTLKTIKDHDWACFSSDGRLVSLCKGKIKEINRGEEKFRICMDRIEIMDIESGKKFRTLTGYATRTVNFSPDGKTLAVAGKKRIRLLNIETGNLIKIFKTGDDLYGIAFSPDGRLMAAGLNTTVKLWNVDAEEPVATSKGHSKEVESIAFSPDGKILASVSKDGETKLWEVGVRKLIGTLERSSYPIAFSPNGEFFVSTYGGTIKFWEVKTAKLLRSIDEGNAVYAVEFSPDGQSFASVQGDETVIWNLKKRKMIRIPEAVSSVAFGPDGKFIATGRGYKEVNLWDAETGRLIKTFSFGKRTKEEFSSVTFGLNGRMLIFAGKKIIIFWEVETGKWVKFFDCILGANTCIWFEKRPHCQKIVKGGFCLTSPIVFAPDGKTFAFGSEKTVQIWDFEKNKRIKILTEHPAEVFVVRFILNGERLLSGSRDGTINCWEVKSGNLIKSLKVGFYSTKAMTFAQDGKMFVLNRDREIEVWDVERGRIMKTIKGKFDEVMCMACSADGRLLLTGNTGGTVDLLHVETGKLKATLASFSDASVVITPAGYFSGSGNFEKYLHFVDGQNRVYEIRHFKEELYRKLIKSLFDKE